MLCQSFSDSEQVRVSGCQVAMNGNGQHPLKCMCTMVFQINLFEIKVTSLKHGFLFISVKFVFFERGFWLFTNVDGFGLSVMEVLNGHRFLCFLEGWWAWTGLCFFKSMEMDRTIGGLVDCNLNLLQGRAGVEKTHGFLTGDVPDTNLVPVWHQRWVDGIAISRAKVQSTCVRHLTLMIAILLVLLLLQLSKLGVTLKVYTGYYWPIIFGTVHRISYLGASSSRYSN